MLSYLVIDGQATLVYSLVNPLVDFGMETLTGPAGMGMVSEAPEDSEFLRFLDGDVIKFPHESNPGFEFPDLSDKLDDIGVQYACDLRRQIRIPSEDTFIPLDDFYFQGDFRAARSN